MQIKSSIPFNQMQAIVSEIIYQQVQLPPELR